MTYFVHHTKRHPAVEAHEAEHEAALSIRLARRATDFLGSPKYIVLQTLVIIVWVALNVVTLHGVGRLHWDPYPFILLNLVFSTQASYAAPMILLAQNQDAMRDRRIADFDYRHNAESLALLRAIHAELHGADCKSCVVATGEQVRIP